jgi:hypothetical protein
MRALGPLCGKSPRAVKRFVNLYRLIRVQKTGSALDAFLIGSDRAPAMFAPIMFALAIEVGLSIETVYQLKSAIQADDAETALSELLAYIDEKQNYALIRPNESKRNQSDALTEGLLSFWSTFEPHQRPAVAAAIQATEDAISDIQTTTNGRAPVPRRLLLKDVADAWQQVARYSFRQQR